MSKTDHFIRINYKKYKYMIIILPAPFSIKDVVIMDCDIGTIGIRVVFSVRFAELVLVKVSKMFFLQIQFRIILKWNVKIPHVFLEKNNFTGCCWSCRWTSLISVFSCEWNAAILKNFMQKYILIKKLFNLVLLEICYKKTLLTF